MVNKVADIKTVLSGVMDPEIPVLSITDLGIVRDVKADAVTITPTYTGCPATSAIEQSIRQALDDAGLGDVRILSTLRPPWTSDWITQEGRAKLKAYGIAPPQEKGDVTCPKCASKDVELISEHGSTACKALYRCRECLEPFDYFKCI